MTYRYLLYGMVVDSDLDLHQDRAAPPGAVADLVVRTAPDGDVCPDVAGEPVLEFERGGARYVGGDSGSPTCATSPSRPTSGV
jgi:hypothetical protein